MDPLQSIADTNSWRELHRIRRRYIYLVVISLAFLSLTLLVPDDWGFRFCMALSHRLGISIQAGEVLVIPLLAFYVLPQIALLILLYRNGRSLYRLHCPSCDTPLALNPFKPRKQCPSCGLKLPSWNQNPL